MQNLLKILEGSPRPDWDVCIIDGRKVRELRLQLPNGGGATQAAFLKTCEKTYGAFAASLLKSIETQNRYPATITTTLTLAKCLSAPGRDCEQTLRTFFVSGPLPRYGRKERGGESGPQRLQWGPVEGREAGLVIRGSNEFVPWPVVKAEVEKRVLNQCAPWVPQGSHVELRTFEGRPDWIMRIVGPALEEIGNVYFGQNPRRKWAFDGLVRVGPIHPAGETLVWREFQRYSGGIYQIIDLED